MDDPLSDYLPIWQALRIQRGKEYHMRFNDYTITEDFADWLELFKQYTISIKVQTKWSPIYYHQSRLIPTKNGYITGRSCYNNPPLSFKPSDIIKLLYTEIVGFDDSVSTFHVTLVLSVVV